MAEHDTKRFSAAALHKELGIPHQYLRHLLTTLSKRGFITGSRGREGGFTLIKPINEIFLADIIDAVEGLDVFSTCIMGFQACPFDHKCAMHETWTETRDKIIAILKNTSLEDFRK